MENIRLLLNTVLLLIVPLFEDPSLNTVEILLPIVVSLVDESLKIMALRVQLLCPVVCFLPILLTTGSSRRAKITKLAASAALAIGLPQMYRETQNLGILLALPSAVSMILSDAASGNRSSRELAELLTVLHQRDAETAKAAK